MPSVPSLERTGNRVGILNHRHLDDVDAQTEHMLAARIGQRLPHPLDQIFANIAHALTP